MRRPSPFLLLAAAVGCGTPAPGPRAVSGHARVRAADGKMDAIDLHRTFLETSSEDGKGGWTVRRGLSTEDGQFSIPEVPPGGYWLRIHDESQMRDDYLWTDADVLDFDQDVPGASDVTFGDPGTSVKFDVGGLSKWLPNDALEFVHGRSGFGAVVYPGPEDDATKLELQTPWTGWPLLGPSDVGLLVQLQRDDGVVPFDAPIRVATITGATLANGATSTMRGTFTEPPAQAYHLAWKRSAFAALAPSIHPSRAGTPPEQRFEVDAMPGGASRGLLTALPPLVLAVDHDALLGNDDKDWTFHVHNPYPDDWIVARFAVEFPVEIPVPGDATQPPQYAGAMISQEVASPLAGDHVVEPLVSPVQHPQIAGKDLFADQAAVGLEPEISWEAPATGTATGYMLLLYRWDGIESGVGALENIAELAVPGDTTRVRLPPGLLAKGRSYALAIRAIHQAGQDVRRHSLFQTALPHGIADVIGNTFTP